MKKILITGGCGYLGARMSKYLAERGYRITVFDSCGPNRDDQWVSLMEDIIIGDIRDEYAISKLLRKDYDVVIHLISLDHHRSEDSPSFVASINVTPTWVLLSELTKKRLETFIYFSTVQVYGKLADEIISEERTPSPQNAYGLTHYMSENICNYFNRVTDTNCIIVRLSNSYGSPVFKENNCWCLVINDVCKMAIEKHKVLLSSDGSPLRDFIHSSDICKAIEILIKANNKEYQENIFHVASGNTLTISELAHMVKNLFEERYKQEIPIYLSNNSISHDSNKFQKRGRYFFDTTRIKNLGFCPNTNLAQGISELFDYLKSS